MQQMQRILGIIIRRGSRHRYLTLAFASARTLCARNHDRGASRRLSFPATAPAVGIEIIDDGERIESRAQAVVVDVDVADDCRAFAGTDFPFGAAVTIQIVDD